MKKLYSELLLSTLAILLLFFFGALLSLYADRSVTRIEALLAATPEPEEFKAAAADERRMDELLDSVTKIKAEAKKAGAVLSFFIHYEYLNALNASLDAFEAAVRGREPAAYGAARAALAEALQSARRAEEFSFERLL